MTNVNDIQVGDRVRLTHENGDVAEFTVTIATFGEPPVIWSHEIMFELDNWETVEVIEKAFKPVPGLYSNTHTGEHVAITKDETAYYTGRDGVWVEVPGDEAQAYDAAQGLEGWVRRYEF